MVRRTIALACVLGSVGAGPSESVRDPSACPGRCARAFAYSLDSRFDAEERGLIEDAMRIWESGTGDRVCFAGNGSDLVIDKLDRSDQLQPWDPDWPKHVALTKGGRIWIVANRLDDANEYRALVVHELGHFLGVGHIEDTSVTYMHSAINDTPGELRSHPRLPVRDARAFCQARRCTCAD